eukprot:gene44855-29379_t
MGNKGGTSINRVGGCPESCSHARTPLRVRASAWGLWRVASFVLKALRSGGLASGLALELREACAEWLSPGLWSPCSMQNSKRWSCFRPSRRDFEEVLHLPIPSDGGNCAIDIVDGGGRIVGAAAEEDEDEDDDEDEKAA